VDLVPEYVSVWSGFLIYRSETGLCANAGVASIWYWL